MKIAPLTLAALARQINSQTNSQANPTKPDVTLFIATLYSGGAERVLLNLATSYIARGLNVDLVVAKYYGALRDQVPEGCRLITLGASRVMLCLPAYLKYLRLVKPPRVISSVENTNIIACLAKLFFTHRYRLVTRVDNALLDSRPFWQQGGRLPWVALIFATFRLSDFVISISGGLKDQIIKYAGVRSNKVVRIYNPIISPNFMAKMGAEIALPEGLDAKQPWLVAVGRLHPQKDYPTLLRALARLKPKHAVPLVILGEGDLKPALTALAADLGIAEQVFFMGYQPNPLAYMHRARGFVLSSAWEGFGNVLVEALATGTPVISTNCPHGPAELLANGEFGTLVPVGDDAALAAAIEQLLQQPKPAMSQALKTHLKQFEIETIADKYLEILELKALVKD